MNTEDTILTIQTKTTLENIILAKRIENLMISENAISANGNKLTNYFIYNEFTIIFFMKKEY